MSYSARTLFYYIEERRRCTFLARLLADLECRLIAAEIIGRGA